MLGSNNNNTLNQQAISGRDTFEAARDINYTHNTYATIDISNFEIYEEDIINTIQFFHNTIDRLVDIPFPDNKGIEIEEKNEINSLSKECFEQIKNKSMAYFGKIRAFFRTPGNDMYVDMYNSTCFEIQQIVNAIRPECSNFDKIFPLVYARLISPYKQTDNRFMRIRLFVYVFLHFMYYNCDIGIKIRKEQPQEE